MTDVAGRARVRALDPQLLHGRPLGCLWLVSLPELCVHCVQVELMAQVFRPRAMGCARSSPARSLTRSVLQGHRLGAIHGLIDARPATTMYTRRSSSPLPDDGPAPTNTLYHHAVSEPRKPRKGQIEVACAAPATPASSIRSPGPRIERPPRIELVSSVHVVGAQRTRRRSALTSPRPLSPRNARRLSLPLLSWRARSTVSRRPESAERARFADRSRLPVRFR